ncbi:hypothetical protein GW17_00039310 [Ensete ventricosum]|nr:hypothetical protein GW17_00039310 [Ensete ventricosum]
MWSIEREKGRKKKKRKKKKKKKRGEKRPIARVPSLPAGRGRSFSRTGRKIEATYARGWFYHKEHQLWFVRVPNLEPLVKTHAYERGSYHCFDPNTWGTILKENFVLHYEAVEKKPILPSDPSDCP